ncbi:MAG: bifunctional 4-hydroxy-2-oxoglutarate aldolase/2-dehydro-3-deoxy-phosphogluconate aldolase [Nocardiopsaceae bacterium]|jgi:2-dehydro-3-deoxyphosphogluconate aldolase/(4S)-4-hydroxy-2-oxoglutarate aldolase|nr:bifunctional 4-hydroxy-2-oxoglutarate aldolase/2-dehydro-3-deoxy-phosphogluconate aldolase [Nocardiopsaceae bacterium]
MTPDPPATGDVLGQLAAMRVIPVVVLDDSAAAAPLAGALAGAGLRCAEVTLRTPAGADAIGIMAREQDLLVGAGTVLDPGQAEHAVEAGARFIVSPGLDEEVIRRCRELSVLALPGAATATEIQRARRAGLRAVKFFPAETLGGVRALDAVSAPFPDLRFIPTGGISPPNLQPYLAHGAVLAVGGSWMVPRQLIAGQDWAQISRLAREAARLAAESGPPPRIPPPAAMGGPAERERPAPRERSQAS